jgi:hypothetical protein
VICFNPEGAERDAKVRERMLAQLGEMSAELEDLARPRQRLGRPP